MNQLLTKFFLMITAASLGYCADCSHLGSQPHQPQEAFQREQD